MRKLFLLNISIITALLIVSKNYAQSRVGINTEEPTRSLDVNGNIRITNLQNKTTDILYDNIVIADKNTGNVDKVPKYSINQNDELQIEIAKEVIIGASPTSSTGVTIGKYVFGYINGRPAIKLSSNPNATIQLQYGLKRLSRNVNQDQAGTYNYENYNKTFTASNWNTFQEILVDENFNKRTFYRLHLVFPGEPYFYRVTFVRLQNSGSRVNYNVNTSQDIFSIICEKYTGTPIQP